MSRLILFIILFTVAVSGTSQLTYTNPVTPDLNISDPFVLQYNDEYYLYATSNSGEGFRCWKSQNLVDWEPGGWIFRKTEKTWGQRNFWAPEVLFHQGKFYLFYSSSGKTLFGEGMRICVAVADNPTGPFHELYAPLFDLGYGTIDAHVYIENDQPYLYFEKVGAVGEFWKRKGYLWGMIFGVELAKDFSKPISEPKLCTYPEQAWEGPKSMWARSNEGMTVFKKDSLYYMMFSANHYADPNYAIGYATSDKPLGSLWVKYEGNPILKKNLQKGVSGPGHNSIIRSPDGQELFIVYHTHMLRDGFDAKKGIDPTEKEIIGRTINIDRLVFKADESLEVLGPTRSPQPMPSGVKR